MQIEALKAGNVIVIRVLEKRLDAGVTETFRQVMAKLIKDGHTLLVLDMSKVEFMDSSGIGAMAASLRLLESNGDIVLFGVSESVQNLFRLTRLDKVFQLFKNEKEAVTALSTWGEA